MDIDTGTEGAIKRKSRVARDSCIEDLTRKSEELTIGPASVDALNQTDFLMPQHNHGRLYGFSISKWMTVSDLQDAAKDVDMSVDDALKRRKGDYSSRPKGTGRSKRSNKKNQREMKRCHKRRTNHLSTKKLMDKQKYSKKEASMIRRIASMKCS